jgi:hypothetical protein
LAGVRHAWLPPLDRVLRSAVAVGAWVGLTRVQRAVIEKIDAGILVGAGDSGIRL